MMRPFFYASCRGLIFAVAGASFYCLRNRIKKTPAGWQVFFVLSRLINPGLEAEECHCLD